MARPRGFNQKIGRPKSDEFLDTFKRLGTQKEVALNYDVSRATIFKWQRELGLRVEYHPYIPRAKLVRGYLSKLEDRTRVAQWLCDEGVISTTYDSKNNNTYLVVGGAMVDDHVLEEIGRILHERVNNQTKDPKPGCLPLKYVRIHSAEAYSLLDCIVNELLGLKRFEAESVIGYFPPSGIVKGRHSTDEFMFDAWVQYAEEIVSRWAKSNRTAVSDVVAKSVVRSWLSSRVARARYFRKDDPENQMKQT